MGPSYPSDSLRQVLETFVSVVKLGSNGSKNYCLVITKRAAKMFGRSAEDMWISILDIDYYV